MSEPERALEGVPDIRAHLERLWRTERKRRRKVSERAVRHWIREHGLPAERFAGGPWEATPSAVTAWWRSKFAATENAGDVRHVADVSCPDDDNSASSRAGHTSAHSTAAGA